MSVGVSDKALQAAIPDADPTARAAAINALLNAGKIDLFKYVGNQYYLIGSRTFSND